MGRIFEESTKRNTRLLDGAWKMRVDAENIGTDERWFDTELDGELMVLSGDGAPIVTFTATLSDGTVVDGDGNIVDVHAPDAGTILRLLRGPEPEHRGHWPVYLVTLFFSAATAVSILFADELFRYGLSFRVRDPDNAEPSDWELASRTIGWTFLTGVILCGYWMGLR